MLDQLMSLIKDNAQDAVVNNPEVPDKHNDDVMKEAANCITGELQDELASGNFKNVLKSLTGQAADGQQEAAGASGSMVNRIKENFINNVMQKFGLSNSTASGIASSLIPLILGKLIHKTNDPNDSSFNLDGILSSLTGGKTSGLDLKSILGNLDKDDDGVDLNDITGMISGAAKGNQQSGGLMDSLKGMFGK